MPLFKAKIAVTSFVEIPVIAKSMKEAVRYLSENEEWKDDLVFQDPVMPGDDRKPIGVEKVTTPEGSEWLGDDICWGSETDETVGMAFYHKELKKIRDKWVAIQKDEDDLSDEQHEKLSAEIGALEVEWCYFSGAIKLLDNQAKARTTMKLAGWPDLK